MVKNHMIAILIFCSLFIIFCVYPKDQGLAIGVKKPIPKHIRDTGYCLLVRQSKIFNETTHIHMNYCEFRNKNGAGVVVRNQSVCPRKMKC
jgi:hypothetical protein